MTYPQAILIAIAVIMGAFLIAQGPRAENPGQGQVAITSVSSPGLGGQAFVARGDGRVRFCVGLPISLAAFRTTKEEAPQLTDEQRILQQKKVPTDEDLIRSLEELRQRRGQPAQLDLGAKENATNERLQKLLNVDILIQCSQWK